MIHVLCIFCWVVIFIKYNFQLNNFCFLDGEKEVCTVEQLQENKIYSRGNHKDFTTFLQKQTDQDNPKVLNIKYNVSLNTVGLPKQFPTPLLHPQGTPKGILKVI